MDAEMEPADAQVDAGPAKEAPKGDLAASLFPELDAEDRAPAGAADLADDAVKDLSQDLSRDMLDWSEDEAEPGRSNGTGAPAVGPGSFKPKPKPAQVPREIIKKDVDDGNFLALMKVFYGRLFPFKKYYQWLSYGNGASTVDAAFLLLMESKCSPQDVLSAPGVQFYAPRRYLYSIPVFQRCRGTQAGHSPDVPCKDRYWCGLHGKSGFLSWSSKRAQPRITGSWISS